MEIKNPGSSGGAKIFSMDIAVNIYIIGGGRRLSSFTEKK